MLVLTACGHFKSRQQKAQDLITQYVKAKLNDPDSYVSVSFSDLYKLKDTVLMLDGKPDSVTHNGWLEIMHVYRCKNAFGGVVTNKEWFQVDSLATKVNCCFVGQHDKAAGND